MRAVLYLRYSSDKQTEQSIEGQRNVCEEYARREHITIVGEYVDRATSASKNIERRLSFLQMIDDASDRSFDAVLVYRLDRFSRDMYEDAIYKHRLKQYDVRVISATEAIPDDPSGIILTSLISGMNQYFSAELSQKVKRGMKVSMDKCLWLGGVVPVGYKIIDKKYTIDEATAPYVRQAFSLYAEGRPLAEVLDYLAEANIKTSYGQPISDKRLCAMLKNKVYAGFYVCKAQNVETPGGVPAIVDLETFDRVQDRIGVARKSSRLGTGKVHAKGLIGKMTCGYCGQRIKATSSRKQNDTRFFYLLCVDGCTGYLTRDVIEDAVFRDIQTWFSEDKIEDLAVRVVELYKSKSDNQKAINEDQAKIAQLKKRLDKLLMLYADEGIESAKEQAKAADLEIKTLTRHVEKLAAQSVAFQAEEVVKFIKGALIEDTDAPRFRQRMFDVLVDRVVLFKDKIEIFYNIDGSSSAVPLSEENCSTLTLSGTPSGTIIERAGRAFLYSLIIL